jgi:outer membrane protein TolC
LALLRNAIALDRWSPACSLAALAAVAALGACRSKTEMERWADRDAREILEPGTARELGHRNETVLQPEKRMGAAPEEIQPTPPAGPPMEPTPPTAPPESTGEAAVAPPPMPAVDPLAASDASKTPPSPQARVLSLREALEIAIESNREYVARKETLYLTALGLSGTRHRFGPLISSTLAYIFADSDSAAASQLATWTAGVTKILPTGGDLAVNGATGFTDDSGSSGSPRTFSSSVGIRLTQPLLRGAGYEASHEALTQAERDLIYAIRDFELYREGFSIDVATRYYNLVQLKQSVENERYNMESVVFGRRQAEALFGVGRASELDMLRARRTELTSRNRMIEVEESYRLSLDQFRIFLGLAPSVQIEVQSEEPAFVEVDYDVQSAIRVALANRLDFLNEKEQLEDSARALRLAENGLLPEMTLNASYDLTSDPDPSFSNQSLDNDSYSLGATLELPVDRLNERNVYRTAQISYRRALRSFEEFEDNLVVNVQSTFRNLERRKESLEIQRQLISDQEKNLAIAQIRFERGELSNRDVDEARQALLDAKNSLIREQVSYEIARLELMRDLGILFIDERGMWIE